MRWLTYSAVLGLAATVCADVDINTDINYLNDTSRLISTCVSAKQLIDMPFETGSILAMAILRGNDARLTKTARLYLMSRLTPLTRAMAVPEQLTEEERNHALRRPPSEVLAKNMKELTGFGTMSEILMHYWYFNRMDLLSDEAIAAIAADWWTIESYEACLPVGAFGLMANTELEARAAQRRAFSTVPDEHAFHETACAYSRRDNYNMCMVTIERLIATNTKQRSAPSQSSCIFTFDFGETAFALIESLATELLCSNEGDAADFFRLRVYIDEIRKDVTITKRVTVADVVHGHGEGVDILESRQDKMQQLYFGAIQKRNDAVRHAVEVLQMALDDIASRRRLNTDVTPDQKRQEYEQSTILAGLIQEAVYKTSIVMNPPSAATWKEYLESQQ
mgnify:CR=1 FL=1